VTVAFVVDGHALVELMVVGVVFVEDDDGLIIGSIEFSRDLLRLLHFLAISISSSEEESYY
jgi:hypothetical protein